MSNGDMTHDEHQIIVRSFLNDLKYLICNNIENGNVNKLEVYGCMKVVENYLNFDSTLKVKEIIND